MFIQTEETPNPATLKFLPGRTVMAHGTAEFRSMEEATGSSPLAVAILGVDGVTTVFLAGDFISVSKRADKKWYVMKPVLLGVIMEHFVTDKPIISEEISQSVNGQIKSEDQKIVSHIKELLDARVRPAVSMDGGDIIFHGYENGVVTLTMHGACSGCPSSTATLKMGIENMLRHYIPEVREVRAANEAIDYY
ncbi:nifU-like domain protein [Candidatus Endolissoclinum faulkneri L2]|uniref:NifU-like domain protein n=1 Tax=Candidatus Endolissoclinum faulkneri L2 TaxID=1193729 RepID=K7ZCD0_9PROT|nr:NifU family protein [Candidatus Endolissoclinum faulkneri]AFX98456.1 nifU-like domain protein [Candidatus Endolissoclinum faulkneri L2]